jgi:hypothetical protein
MYGESEGGSYGMRRRNEAVYKPAEKSLIGATEVKLKQDTEKESTAQHNTAQHSTAQHSTAHL